MDCVYRVSGHTKHVGPGSTYVAIPGTKVNGLDFITQAIEKGARRVVVPHDAKLSTEISELCKKNKVELVRVDDTRAALAELSAQAYDYPANKLKLLAVTGTDGKTTSSYLLYHMLRSAGFGAALLSGVEHMIGDEVLEADLTTEKPDYLHHFFNECVQRGIQFVVMEISAQAHTMHRIDGLTFDGAIFTNLAREHGETYQTLDEYLQAKLGILAHNRQGAPLAVCIDNEWSRKVLNSYPDAITTGFANDAAGQVVILQETARRQFLEVRVGDHWIALDTPLIGSYNAQNIAGAAVLAHQLGAGDPAIASAVEKFAGAPGRLEYYQLANGATAIVDYAHTPQALSVVLPALKKRARRLFAVFGAAGGKDKEKRPMMGKIAVAYADRVFLTMDNPRMEDPEVILDEVMSELTPFERAGVVRELDRAQAIQMAAHEAGEDDIIFICGKGRETVQIIGAQRVPYSDIAVVKSLMY